MVAVIFRGEIAAREHQKLLECALSRDAASACEVLETHIQGCVEHALSGDVSSWFPRAGTPRKVLPALHVASKRLSQSGTRPRPQVLSRNPARFRRMLPGRASSCGFLRACWGVHAGISQGAECPLAVTVSEEFA